MSIWFLLWLFLSLTLLYFFGWTLLVLYRQKKAWKVFAAKKKLRYVPGGYSDAPQMEGIIDDYEFSFFPAQYELGDVRHSRKMTAIEITLKSNMPFDGFVASGMLIDAARTADLPHEYKPNLDAWRDEDIILTTKPGAMDKYLTAERLDVISRWMHVNNMWFLLGFRNDVFLMRVDTPLPLDNPKRINALVKKLLADIPTLELAKGEDGVLHVAPTHVDGENANDRSVLQVNDDTGATNLTLENDSGDDDLSR